MLAKTEFLHGCQCHLRLWYEARRPDLATAREPSAPEACPDDWEVQALVRRRWEGRQLHADPEEALQGTAELVQDRNVDGLFEPAFAFQGVQVRSDVLARADGDAWHLVSVKASGGCQPSYELELALQAWVLAHAGLALRSAEVLTLNTAYVYDGRALDPERLFKRHDRTRQVAAKAGAIGMEVVLQQAILARPEPPEVRPGRHCFEPSLCPFHAHCTRGLARPDHPLSELPRLSWARQEALESMGCDRIEQIPDAFELTPAQRRVRDCVLADRAWVSPHLGAALAALDGPVHALAIEAFSPALPRHAGMRPFQRVPFQWSVQMENGPGGSFLPEDEADPRERFATSLLEVLGTRGSILVYSGFEAGVILELAEGLPHLAQPLRALLPRLVELLELLRDHYYHPGFHGSYALRRVLSVLVPEREASSQAIRQGEQASRAFRELMARPEPARREQLRRELLAYGRGETQALMKVRQALVRLA